MIQLFSDDKRELFSYYNSVDEFVMETQRAFNSLNEEDQNRINRGVSQDFTGSDDLEELNGPITEFINPDKLSQAVDNIKELFKTINIGGSFEKDRVVATEKPIGVFDFSLAAKGLFRPQEYFCPELNRIVPENNVKLISKDPRQFCYYETIDGLTKSFTVIQQQKGTNAVRIKNEYKQEMIRNGYSDAEAEKMAKDKYPKAKLKFSTKTKKIYFTKSSKLLAKNKKGEEKFVDVFIPIGGAYYQSTESLMYVALPALLTAYFLQKAGIKTRILGATAQRSLDSGKDFFDAVVLKDYDRVIDFNSIAIFTADSRIFRYKIFQRIAVVFKTLFRDGRIPSGLSGPLNQSDDYMKIFSRYKKFYAEHVSKFGDVRNRNIRLMVTANYAPSKFDVDYPETMMEKAVQEFFKLIDALDIEYNSSKVAIPRIKKRELARGNDVDTLRTRLMGSINMTTSYDPNESKNKLFIYSPKQKQEIDKLKQDLVKDLNSYMKNYTP